MKQSLQLKLGQSLTMTPQLQQAIRLLQLSSLELQTEIQDALDSNMMLEVAEEETEPNNTNEEQKSLHDEIEQNVLDLKESLAKEKIPDDLPVDSAWDDIYDSNINYSKQQEPFDYSNVESQNSQDKTLREHLLWQLNLAPTSDLDRAIATAIIDALDDDGYLTCSLEEILNILGGDGDTGLEEVQAMLRLVQAMDPLGVAARDIQECLLLQMAHIDQATNWLSEAKELIKNHIQLLGTHDFNQLMRRMKLNLEQLKEVVDLIQSLNPRPGSRVQDMNIQYITPDVYVKKENGVWKVELNVDTTPRLRINSYYAKMIRRALIAVEEHSPPNSVLT